MKHGRPDYDGIQDSSGKIPEDEPVMIFRAMDCHAIETIEHYVSLVRATGGDPKIIQSAQKTATMMKEYQKIHGIKKPDVPEDVVIE